MPDLMTNSLNGPTPPPRRAWVGFVLGGVAAVLLFACAPSESPTDATRSTTPTAAPALPEDGAQAETPRQPEESVRAYAGPPVRVAGNVPRPQQVRSVNPFYPGAALRARVTGVVTLEVVIGVDGLVTDVEVVDSVPLLDEAAVAAVEQWEYAPTVLNGVPVPVVMPVTVTFSLP